MVRHHTIIVCLIGLCLTAPAAWPEAIETDTQLLIEGLLYDDAISNLESIDATSDDYATAQRLLGEIYSNGLGVQKDDVKAAQLFRMAATAGDSRAAFLLGLAYETGVGVVQSGIAAFNWYDLAAETDPDAALRYAEIALANADNASIHVRHNPIALLEYSADNQNSRAQYILGRLYLDGELVPQDINRGTSLIASAANSVPEAKTALATLLNREGKYQEAAPLFEEAMAMGDSSAAAYLGFYAENGLYGPVDRKRALSLYTKALSVGWAAEGARRIEEHLNSVDVFGVRLYGVSRHSLRNSFEQVGLARLSSDVEYFDAFDASALIDRENTILTAAYSPNAPEYLGELNYAFTSKRGREVKDLIAELESSLVEQYGEYDSQKRNSKNHRTVWKVGAITISVNYEHRTDIVNVTYKFHPYSEHLSEYVALKRKSIPEGLDNAL